MSRDHTVPKTLKKSEFTDVIESTVCDTAALHPEQAMFDRLIWAQPLPSQLPNFRKKLYNKGKHHWRKTLLDSQIMKLIEEQIKTNRVVLYMKGTPQWPQCGFSARAVQLVTQYTPNFLSVDVLANPDIRSHLPAYADWPTFPQLYIQGEFIGGSDILQAMEDAGELKALFEGLA